ncbi:capsular polysaccharide biosynthesis protein [Pseudodesulfovibrio indicus]|uniref:capsular polysaccharide biosynthesis protein n=1 Tax=Pseudodesulfovibrio indicus TaxID=1716143 RepID=UPI0029308CE2|nr:capsular polysaccharide biosynthesis protein [Pseudodesulfovibrio indicus]
MIGVFSSGMLAIPHLEAFLGDSVLARPSSGEGIDAVAGWGHKPTAAKARRLAGEWGKPYLAVEDGFLRSLGLGVSGCAPLSVVIDDLGIYYDATGPSRLEQLIADGCPEEDLVLARQAMEIIRRERLSKYNHAPKPELGLFGGEGGPRILLVDQTRGDASVELGLAGPESFSRMCREAVAAHPGARFYIKTHPDVVAGKKQGYLSREDVPGAEILARDLNPLCVLEQMDHVYTVSSQLGFEALLLGKRVHCYGAPFYSGWGLTEDSVKLPRRTANRSLEEVFAAAYVRYARYVSPYTGERCSILDTLDTLTDQIRHEERNRGNLVCAGFSWWRKGIAQHLFRSLDGRIEYRRTGPGAAARAREVGGRVVAWAAKTPQGTHEAARGLGVPVTFVEDGFLRSSGLGSDFHYPYSLCLDSGGPYFDPNTPNDLEALLALTEFDERLLARARALREAIVAKGVTKYNVGNREALPAMDAGGRVVVLVVGQVEDDKSVLSGGMGIHSDRELLAEVRRNRPDAFIVYKPHPDVVSGNRRGGAFSEQDAGLYDRMESSVSLSALFGVIDELHTLTSLSGFEALMRDVPVHTYGGPFYAGWGLTTDKHRFPRRGRSLTMEELVAGALILYPSYYDWGTELFCGPETVLMRLAAGGEPRQGKLRRRCCVFIQKMISLFSALE